MWKRQECRILQKDWEVLTLPRNEVERDVEDIENRYPKSTAHGVPSNDESGVGGRSTITSDGTAAKESNRPRSNMLQEYGKRHLARTRGELHHFHEC